ncbi:hypothetical protein ACT3CE_00435 [Marinifilum sp. RC60d5]|uniref:hypothetical protein n=1 Tax=Marinifilum sp. RC60d5 TaxID=3458414 RepID=UPI004035BF21
MKILTNEDSTWMETVEKKIPKERVIFKKGRIHNYKATYLNSKGELLSQNEVNIHSTGERWEQQPEKQDLIYYEFPTYKSDSIKLSNYNINKELQNWTGKQSEGIIENVEEVWMHPIRVNQYKFTEVAPFPEVRFPLEKGKKWKSSLTINKGWGEWNNLEIANKYKITGRTKYTLSSLKIDCWIIESTSKSSIGKSTLYSLFTNEYGFVKMVYRNYKKEKLIFELIKVTD